MAKRSIHLVSAAAVSDADDWVDDAEAEELLVRIERWRSDHPARQPKWPYAATLHTRPKKAGSVTRAASGAPAAWAVHEELMVVPFAQKVAQGEEIKKL